MSVTVARNRAPGALALKIDPGFVTVAGCRKIRVNILIESVWFWLIEGLSQFTEAFHKWSVAENVSRWL